MSYTEEITYRIAADKVAEKGGIITAFRYFDEIEVRQTKDGLEVDGEEYSASQIESLRNLIDVLQPREAEDTVDAPPVPVEAVGDWDETVTYADAGITVWEFGTTANIAFASREDAIEFLEQALAAARAGL